MVKIQILNHYLTPEFFIYVGKDKRFIGHSGNIAYVKFKLGDGSSKKKYYTNNKNSFRLKKAIGFTSKLIIQQSNFKIYIKR